MKVKTWTEKVIIPTYGVGLPEKNPMFFEKRVYQGSSGAVYPNPVIEKIMDDPEPKEYNAVFLENKYLKIMVLPELGGRVQMAYDKIANRHFIYYNQVIKPALVGLCGPWISGGIEFNWPQHHRPSTYDPIDFSLEEHADGSATIWVNEVEKMFHTKGMTGFKLYEDRAYLEINTKLFNRTSLPQTFLWWANPAVKVNDHYQSVFPPDVKAVFDHGKRDVSSFPVATGTYYKVDYSPGTDISRYKNIPVPTSYMAMNSSYDFVGGYEHDTKAGVLHIADHHVSPGKKQWTWGTGDFGLAWERNLTDKDGPYIELMAGVFTDNQPDFTWLMPFEEKSFSQYFLPYRELGMIKNASKDLLLNAEFLKDELLVKIFSTTRQSVLELVVSWADIVLYKESFELNPEKVYQNSVKLSGQEQKNLLVSVRDAKGDTLIDYKITDEKEIILPKAAKPAAVPLDMDNVEQLFLTAQHLEQYRHATYNPVPYYERALYLEPKDVRCNNALGLWYLRRGKFELSEGYFRKALDTLIERNPNPYDSEPYYNLGLSLKYQGRIDEAYDAFFKASWSAAWQDSAYFFIAQTDLAKGAYEKCLEHINWSLDRNARNSKGYVIKIKALRKLHRIDEALECVKAALERDRFNIPALFEWLQCTINTGSIEEKARLEALILQRSQGNAHTLIDYAIDYIDCALFEDAISLLKFVKPSETGDPMLNYYLGYCHSKIKDLPKAAAYLISAARSDFAYCFPNRLQDILVLRHALVLNNLDAKAAYYLGNLYYDKKQYIDAIQLWLQSASVDNKFAVVFRNLGIAFYNKRQDKIQALNYFETAFSLDPSDSRVLMELDQLYKRLNWLPEKRLNFLENHRKTAEFRDDIYLEMLSIHNFLGNSEKALGLLMDRKFHPWEGGEGKVVAQYTYAKIEIAKQHLVQHNLKEAIISLEAALIYPENLGEGKLTDTPENDIHYWLGWVQQLAGNHKLANSFFEKATLGRSALSAAVFYNDQQPDKIFYQGLAWQKLGSSAKAQQIFNSLIDYGDTHLNDHISLDYFAVSLPDLMIFDDDLDHRNIIHCLYMQGLGFLGLKDYEKCEERMNQVLQKDAMHLGAKTHLLLMKSILQPQI